MKDINELQEVILNNDRDGLIEIGKNSSEGEL